MATEKKPAKAQGKNLQLRKQKKRISKKKRRNFNRSLLL